MRTRQIYASENLTFRDSDYSPARGSSLWETCPQLAALDPAVAFTFFDDFFDFQAQSSNHLGWTQTTVQAGAGSAAVVIADAVGGVLQITNDDADNDSVELQWHAETFKLAAGKPLWFEARVKVSDATQSDLIVGLCITDSTLVTAMTDGVYFRKNDGDANLNAVTEKNSTETSTDTTSDIVADAWIKLGFYFNGSGSVYFYVNGVLKATHTANICDDEELAVSFAIQNGEAVAKIGYVDYIKVVQIR